MALTITTATSADLPEIVAIWQANVVALRGFLPGGAQNVPDHTVGSMGSLLLHDLVTTRLARNNGVLDMFLTTTRNPRSAEVIMFFVRAGVGASALARLADRGAVLRNSGLRLLVDLATDARTRGVPEIVAHYPAAGQVTMLAVLSEMTARNGIQPTGERSGWVTYRVTPDQLLTGIAGVLP